MKLVVDASVVIPYFLPEGFIAAAARWFGGGYELIAPDLLIIEAGNVLSKKARLGNVEAADAEDTLGGIADGEIQIPPSAPLARAPGNGRSTWTTRSTIASIWRSPWPRTRTSSRRTGVFASG